MRITAHSGCDHTPDNSLTSVRHALSLPVDAFEIDVHCRRDGVLVLAHDSNPDGSYEGCPTLAEAFRLASATPRCGINCDLKEPGLERAVCEMCRAEAPENPLYLSGTVSPTAVKGVRDMLCGGVVLLNAEEIVPDFYARMLRGDAAACGREAAAQCQACGATVVNVYSWCCPADFRLALAAQHIGISVWTVNSPSEALVFQSWQVFNLTTRLPGRLLPILRPNTPEETR